MTQDTDDGVSYVMWKATMPATMRKFERKATGTGTVTMFMTVKQRVHINDDSNINKYFCYYVHLRPGATQMCNASKTVNNA